MYNYNMYKILENIELQDTGEIKEIRNKFSSVKRIRKNFVERFFMPYGYDALVYELDKEGEVDIVLDIRASYENPEFGRIYKIKKSRSGLIIEYKHEKTKMFF